MYVCVCGDERRDDRRGKKSMCLVMKGDEEGEREDAKKGYRERNCMYVSEKESRGDIRERETRKMKKGRIISKKKEKKERREKR